MIKYVYLSLILILAFFDMTRSKKIPLYLSIETETDKVREQVYDYIRKAMEELILAYPDDSQIQYDYLQIFKEQNLRKSKFVEPNSWHTTCLFIGKNYSQLDSYIYKNFEEGIEMDLTTSTFVYIPNKIMSSPVFLKNFPLIDNKYPHITLMVGKYRAVDSNYVLKALFDNYSDLNAMYKDGRIESKDQTLNLKLDNVEIFFEDLKKTEIAENVYILKNKNYLKLPGFTKKN